MNRAVERLIVELLDRLDDLDKLDGRAKALTQERKAVNADIKSIREVIKVLEKPEIPPKPGA